MERSSRELDVLKLMDAIKGVGAIDKVKFISERISSTSHLPACEAARLLNQCSVQNLSSNWRELKALYNAKCIKYPEQTHAEWWEDLN